MTSGQCRYRTCFSAGNRLANVTAPQITPLLSFPKVRSSQLLHQQCHCGPTYDFLLYFPMPCVVLNIMYSSGSWKFYIFAVAFLYTVVDAFPSTGPNINLTISVPADISDYGDPNLLYTPMKSFNILIFFLANYFVHTVTVNALSGESTKNLAFAVFFAITFPLSGVSSHLEAIVRHASFCCDDLKKAARAGALCIIVRSADWKPDPIRGLEASVY